MSADTGYHHDARYFFLRATWWYLAVEADGNRTHILRVQTGCSPVELRSQTSCTERHAEPA